MRWTQSDEPQNKEDAEKREKAGAFLYAERQDGGGAGKCGLKQSTNFNLDPANAWQVNGSTR